ncbi:MAG TPA: amidohydrolase family protein [Vicinamibacterales bacterium]|nr:amidohydrolase family protein [Vicinamibacterales bacterium]
MSRLVAVIAAAFSLLCAEDLLAQNLVIANARILTGTGAVIEQGSIVVRDGRIVSVASGGAAAQGTQVIDARGMTALPGFIDAHRHIINGDDDRWFKEQSVDRMREFLESGYTTLMSGGGPFPGILELKRRVESGALKGPRIITSGRVDPDNFKTEEVARAQVRKYAQAGIEIIKARIDPEPTELQKSILAIVIDEGRKHKLDVMVHAVSVPAMLAALDAGAPKLVHTPHGGWLSIEDARKVAAAGVETLSTIGFGVPVFGVFNKDNVPTFRDGKPWPESILDGKGRGREAGEKAVNGRTLWDAGVTYGFGTDTNYHPREGLKHELRALSLMFSTTDILKLMGPNTAAFIEKSKDLGTLEAGKLADIVLVTGDPLDLITNLLNVKVVVKDGAVVVDKR